VYGTHTNLSVELLDAPEVVRPHVLHDVEGVVEPLEDADDAEEADDVLLGLGQGEGGRVRAADRVLPAEVGLVN
jgi:hypothetical protein